MYPIKTSLTASALAYAVASLMPATAAQAATYVATRTIGAATADISITTDGTLGALSASHVTDWTISLSDGLSAAVMTKANSYFSVVDEGFVATSSDLLFDFDLSGNGLVFQSLTGRNLYCLTATDLSCAGYGAGELIVLGNPAYTAATTGTLVMASVPGVPEPATWAMMVAGFGAIGLTARRKSATAVQFA